MSSERVFFFFTFVEIYVLGYVNVKGTLYHFANLMGTLHLNVL